MFTLSQFCSMETLSSWVLCSHDMTSLIFKSFLAFWYKRSHIHLYLPCPSPGISHFSKEPGVPFSREWYLETKIRAPFEICGTSFIILGVQAIPTGHCFVAQKRQPRSQSLHQAAAPVPLAPAIVRGGGCGRELEVSLSGTHWEPRAPPLLVVQIRV